MFTVDNRTNEIVAEIESEKEIIITAPRFMQNENSHRANEYLHRVANELNALIPFSDVMTAKLEEIEQHFRDAEIAEKFLEPVVL